MRRHSVGSDLDPNHLPLLIVLVKDFLKILILKKVSAADDKKKYPKCLGGV